MKERFFWVALSLIGISWMLNSIYAYSKQLDEPIFLDHYIDAEYQDDFYMTFYYLTNKNNSSVVSSVSTGKLIGYPEDSYFFDEQVQNNQVFNHHVLRSTNVRFNFDPTTHTENYSFTEIDVSFSDGNRITVPIGIVTIRPRVIEESPLEQVSSSGDSYHYRALEPLTIEMIKSSFQDVLQDNFFIKINSSSTPSIPERTDEKFLDHEWSRLPGLDLQNIQFPLNLKKSKRISVYSQFAADFKAVLDVNIYISGTTESGKPFSTVGGLIVRPYLEQKDINKIIKEKTMEDPDE